MAYRRIEVTPLAGALGAEVSGVDLSQDPGNETFDEIHRAFLEHLALFFRDQALTPQQQVAFAARFGPIGIYPFAAGLPDAPEVVEIVKTEDETVNFGSGWHTDTAYLEKPSLGSVLYAKEVPAAGGDTLFANSYLAYETLSDGMRAMLDGLTAVHSAALKSTGGRAARMRRQTGMAGRNIEQADALEGAHPLVRTHPGTGRKALYVSANHTVRFQGMTQDESRPLIRYLLDHATRPEFTCRFRWTPGALAIWDNRCTQHYALNDYHGARRRMHRVTVEGDVPG